MEERDVVRVGEVPRRGVGELAEAHRQHRSPQRVLERLSRAEIGRERQRPDHLGSTDRPFAGGHCRWGCFGVFRSHAAILRRIPVASDPTMGSTRTAEFESDEGVEMPEQKIGTRAEWQAARDELAKLEGEQAANNVPYVSTFGTEFAFDFGLDKYPD